MKGRTHQIDHPQIKRLNELMELKGISKAEMARIAGVSPQSVNNWFARGTIGKSSALKLAEALGVSVAWTLCEGDDSETGLSERQLQLLNLFEQLPESEQDNMIAAFSARLKELDEFVEKYVRKRVKSDE
ncbi:helix-turn-helix domain-containing protein [Serratia marcescens]|uniref:helix-turn-helix domain-containing protein n=1 Tax=Serratia marcescens TaxID=615 RepID=UPI0022254E3B|nr:helix-turn-helix domain-containing protein [Serratia marcescens]UYY65516.1 helix-turn-helix domain-containing protein [Serratia marcescens]